jgi:ABC-type multidrug transport system ATPase subunit
MSASAPGSGPLLEFEHVSKAFGHQPALADVSFHLARGEIVGFAGPNGAGKSTTLRILVGLLRPDSGTVRVEGVDRRSASREVRRQIGALIESPAFYPTLTALDHLRYVARLRGCADGQPLEATPRNVGLDPRSGKPVGQYSLGMKQRLGIAMAILDAPALLVLDEPMNGLDPVGMAELREFLRRLPEAGTSVLVSSHLLNEVRAPASPAVCRRPTWRTSPPRWWRRRSHCSN